MATGNKKNKKKLFQNLSFKDERLRVILGFLTLSIAVFLFLSFFSFFFTWDQDQSVFEYPLGQFLFDSNLMVDNWGAKLGALFAKKFIHDWFGISSFMFILLSVVVGFRFLKVRLLPFRETFRIALLTIAVVPIVFGYIFSEIWDANFGGLYGYVFSRWIVSIVGSVGGGLIVFVILSAYVFYTFKNSLEYLKQLIFRTSVEEDIPVVEESYDTDGFDDVKNVDERSEKSTDYLVAQDEEDSVLDDDVSTRQPVTEKVVDPSIEIVLDSKPEEKEEKEEENDDSFSIEVRSEEEMIEVEPVVEDDSFAITNLNEKVEMADEINDEALGDYDPTLELSHYKLPPIDLLADHRSANSEVSEEELHENKNKIVETLNNYKIQIDKIKATIGPTVTLYEIVPAPGVRISKIKNLEDDIALSLAALGIRIIAPIPGKGTIGIEVPNKKPEVVSMRAIIASKKFQETDYELPLALGKTISNETYVVNLAKMPHLLVAGATGQGKSVGLNAILTSLLYKKHPSQLKFVLVDPKKVELTLYSRIENHYLAKLPDEEEAIITDTQKVVNTLNSLCIEMDDRYELLKRAQMRNLVEYNAKFVKRKLNPNDGHRYLPYIVVVIDEFADLIMTAGKEVELPLARLAQLARAIGIHLIIATQRPTTNIITGIIKANFPARIAFRVTSSMDSRTILDGTGANQLIGKGDMLISQGSDVVRLQCAFVDTPEVEEITGFIEKQQSYGSALFLPEYQSEDTGGGVDVDLGKRDALFEDAARLIVINQQGSTSLIQRKFSIGYNRAGRIVDQLEAAGIVGPFEGSKARQVLVQDEIHLEQLLSNLGI